MKRDTTDWKSRLIISLAPSIYSAYMWFVYYTSKKTYINHEGFRERMEKGEGLLVAIWHQSILLITYPYRYRGGAAIASRSRDGEIISRVLNHLGLVIFRGSSSSEGGKVFRSMIGFLRRSRAWAALTVDGPRGPVRKVKPGIIRMAQLTGKPIYPLHGWARRKIILKSWDRTMVPLPFNHLVFICGKPITVPRDTDKGGLQLIKKELELRLNQISKKAETILSL